MNFWELTSDHQIISHVLEEGLKRLYPTGNSVTATMYGLIWTWSWCQAARPMQFTRASPWAGPLLSARPQSWFRPLSHRSKNKAQGYELAARCTPLVLWLSGVPQQWVPLSSTATAPDSLEIRLSSPRDWASELPVNLLWTYLKVVSDQNLRPILCKCLKSFLTKQEMPGQPIL